MSGIARVIARNTGVQAAAENYFSKNVEELTLAEMALLAGLPKAPGRDSPKLHPQRAKARQAYVLNRMVEEDYITQEQVEDYLLYLIEPIGFDWV